MSEASKTINNTNSLRSKRETCISCTQRSQCIRPIKDTEDEDTSLTVCDKYKAGTAGQQKAS